MVEQTEGKEVRPTWKTRTEPIDARIEVNSSYEDAEWMQFVESAPGATPAHLIEWRDLIAESSVTSPCIELRGAAGKYAACCPRFWSVVRFSARTLSPCRF